MTNLIARNLGAAGTVSELAVLSPRSTSLVEGSRNQNTTCFARAQCPLSRRSEKASTSICAIRCPGSDTENVTNKLGAQASVEEANEAFPNDFEFNIAV